MSRARTPISGPSCGQLAQSILDRIDPAVRVAAAAAAGADGPGKCQQVWCPVCALAALVSGEQHPLLTVIAEHSVALLTVVRAMVDDIESTAGGSRRRATTASRRTAAVGSGPVSAHPGDRRGVTVRVVPKHRPVRPNPGGSMWYWLFKYIFMGPLLTLLGRPKVEGLEYVPDSGAVILASNHLAVADSFYLPLVVTRRITFLAKAEYFDRHRPQGLVQTLVLHGGRAGADRPHRRRLRAGRPGHRASGC